MSEALKTDLYQLTMAAAAYEADLNTVSSFEMFTRKLEAGRGFYIAAGLELVLDYLENLRFTGSQIDWLRKQHAFKHISKGFFDFLRGFRFKGDVWAMPEGTPFFPRDRLLDRERQGRLRPRSGSDVHVHVEEVPGHEVIQAGGGGRRGGPPREPLSEGDPGPQEGRRLRE